jgi:hypothetical protein
MSYTRNQRISFRYGEYEPYTWLMICSEVFSKRNIRIPAKKKPTVLPTSNVAIPVEVSPEILKQMPYNPAINRNMDEAMTSRI